MFSSRPFQQFNFMDNNDSAIGTKGLSPSLGNVEIVSLKCILYTFTKYNFNTFKHGRNPLPPEQYWSPVYEITKSPDGSRNWMIAKRSLDVGDFIVAERPLMAVPFAFDYKGLRKYLSEALGADSEGHSVLEAMLKVAFDRMSEENQEAYMALHDGLKNPEFKLTSIFLSNFLECGSLGTMYAEENTPLYRAVLNEMSSI
ncbi:hypothetical protein BDQ17DRAFT_1433281 [Cyathus striatus]|nr:hypothetical protein BDQ17DRAFT_1433281 [Cyathus striatus]